MLYPLSYEGMREGYCSIPAATARAQPRNSYFLPFAALAASFWALAAARS